MPTSMEILDRLTVLAGEMSPLAIAWHAVVLAAAIALYLGWRPTDRVAIALLVAPLLSVAVLGFAYGTPFNGLLFAILAVAAALLASRASTRPVARIDGLAMWLGGALIVFAWIYPHFVDGGGARYLYEAPLGLIPCPTLALVIGFGLLGAGLRSAGWSLLIAAAGVFYAVVGVAWLHVWIDGVLGIGAAALLVLSAQQWRLAPIDEVPVAARFSRPVTS